MMRFRAGIAVFLLFAAGDALAAAEPQGPEANAPAASSAPKTIAERSNELFERLAKTQDPDEADGIEAALNRLRLQSGSDTADLLMSRALSAMSKSDYPLALSLLDSLVDIQPDWAEAWNKRATVRYFAGDPSGSVADIAQTLKRDPRHVGALSGLGMILKDEGRLEDAMRAYDRALEIAPALRSVRDAADRVRSALAGRSL